MFSVRTIASSFIIVICAACLSVAAQTPAPAAPPQAPSQTVPPQVQGRPQPPPPQGQSPQVPGNGFVGRWESDWGAMQIDVVNGKVTGMYQRKQGRIEGDLSADGRTLTGFWRQAPSYILGEDGGPFIFTLSSDGNSFDGTIWFGQGAEGKPDDFVARRVVPGTPPPTKKPRLGPQIGSFDGRWDSDWGALSAEVKGSAVKGTFSKANGRIEGTLSEDGTVLTGRWSKAPTYKTGADGGAFVFKLSRDGKLIQGTYWNKDQAAGLGTRWQATRTP